MRPVRLSEKAEFSAGKFLPQLLYGSRWVRAFLLSLSPGQELPPRADSEAMLGYIVDGQAELTVGSETFSVGGGEFAAAEPGQIRGIKAQSRCVVLWIQVSAAERSADD